MRRYQRHFSWKLKKIVSIVCLVELKKPHSILLASPTVKEMALAPWLSRPSAAVAATNGDLMAGSNLSNSGYSKAVKYGSMLL
jgi:hypothetical protein